MKTKLHKSKNQSCQEVWKRRMITEKEFRKNARNK